MGLAEGLVSGIVQSVLKNKTRELETLKRDTTKLQNVKPPFPRISYEDAIAVLQKHGNPAKVGDHTGGHGESIISKEFDRRATVQPCTTSVKTLSLHPYP